MRVFSSKEWLLAGVVFLALPLLFTLAAQDDGPASDDPFRGMPSHQVPGCSPAGGKGSVPCRCLGMVNDIQTIKASECWAKVGLDSSGDAPRELRLFAPEHVKKCLAAVPDHCRVVAMWPDFWGYTGDDLCRTSCKPQRCKCADSGCRSHAASEDY